MSGYNPGPLPERATLGTKQSLDSLVKFAIQSSRLAQNQSTARIGFNKSLAGAFFVTTGAYIYWHLMAGCWNQTYRQGHLTFWTQSYRTPFRD